MTKNIERRLAELEQAAPSDKITALFVWKARRDGFVLLATSCNGQKFEQAEGESADAFRARVRHVIEGGRPPGKSTAVVFVDEMDVAL